MHRCSLYVFLTLTIQLYYFSGVLSQITFTREWVAGKRGISQNNVAAMASSSNSDDSIILDLACKSTWPAIYYLLEIEKLREERCGSATASSTATAPKKASLFLRKINEKYPNLFIKDDSQTFDDDSNINGGLKMQNP